MICPHCNYEHGCGEWNRDTLEYNEDVKGDCDGFYTLALTMERDADVGSHFFNRQITHMYGCPSCMKTFIGA